MIIFLGVLEKLEVSGHNKNLLIGLVLLTKCFANYLESRKITFQIILKDYITDQF